MAKLTAAEQKAFLKDVAKVMAKHGVTAKDFVLAKPAPKPKAKKLATGAETAAKKCVKWGTNPVTGEDVCLKWE